MSEIHKLQGPDLNTHWYAFQVSERLRSSAQINLSRQGFRIFCPTISVIRRHARKEVLKTIPLFPGYGFVELDLEQQRWTPINGTFGVISIVVIAGHPASLPVGLVEELIASSDHQGNISPVPAVSVGQNVKILNGPFSGAIGMLTRLNDKGRIELLLEWLNGNVRVSTSVNNITIDD